MGRKWNRRHVIRMIPIGASVLVTGALESNTNATPLASPAATPMASPILSASQHQRPAFVTDRVTIDLTDDGFRPDYVQTTNGHDLHVTLRNTGSRRHGFVIDALDIDVVLAPGEETRVTIRTPPLGDFTYVSDESGDASFRGTLVFYI